MPSMPEEPPFLSGKRMITQPPGCHLRQYLNENNAMREKFKNYLRLKRLLSAGFFISGIIPILIIAAGAIYNFKQMSIDDLSKPKPGRWWNTATM